MSAYANPPITEASVEFRFEVGLDKSAIERVSKKLRSSFPIQNSVKFHDVSIKFEDAPEFDSKSDSRTKMSDESESKICIIGENSISVSRLAPYTSFDEFSKIIEMVWDTTYKATSFRKLSRLGMRYLNRIDVPNNGLQAPYEEYLNLRINLPQDFQNVNGYQLACILPINDNYKARIASNSMPSVLIDFSSFLLDIDVFTIQNHPQKKSEIFKALEEMRTHKNNLFEAFVTSKAKDVFGVR